MNKLFEIKMTPPSVKKDTTQIENMTLANRDLMLYKIKQQIKNKKGLLLQKSKSLEKKKKVNHFLENVKEDYKTYYNYIIKEKKQQYEAMSLIKQYLDDLMKVEKMTDHEVKKAKYDQKVILGEIEKIKGELDELTAV
jgi:hypothetical protein